MGGEAQPGLRPNRATNTLRPTPWTIDGLKRNRALRRAFHPDHESLFERALAAGVRGGGCQAGLRSLENVEQHALNEAVAPAGGYLVPAAPAADIQPPAGGDLRSTRHHHPNRP